MTSFMESAREALAESMSGDPGVVVLGEDVVPGGPFGLTKKLADRFGVSRVRNTPISEAAVMGVALGMALGGKRPFVDVMFSDFITLASDQLFNHAAKIHFMSGGRYTVPLTVWTVGGAGTRWGSQHSQRVDGWLTQVPGLKVLAPASPRAAALAVASAIEDPDPVVIIADRALLYSGESLPQDGSSPWRCRVVRTGTSVTVVATGRLVHLALAAADQSGIDAEVIDVQCLAPLDVDTIAASVTRTARLLAIHDEPAPGGVASQIAAAVSERAFWSMDAPPRRLTSPPTPVPAGAELEDAYVIGIDAIAAAMKEIAEV